MKQPNQWTCASTSLAMLLQWPTERVHEELGHDGSEIIFPEHKEPFNRRGFHIQEFQDLLIRYGYLLAEIQALPASISFPMDIPFEIPYPDVDARLLAFMQGRQGIVAGRSSTRGAHMCMWDGVNMHDPGTGEIADPYRWPITVDQFYCLTKCI